MSRHLPPNETTGRRDPIRLRSLVHIVVIVLAIKAIHEIDPWGKRQSLGLHGVLDWAGHLLTAGIVAIGLQGWRVPQAGLWAVFLGGVLPDIGHLLTVTDLTEPVAGSTRNGSHSLVVVGGLVALAVIDRRRGGIWLGMAAGALTHLWRDMGTGTVPLLWPWSERVFSVSFAQYLAGIGLTGSVLIIAGATLRTGRTRPDPGSLPIDR